MTEPRLRGDGPNRVGAEIVVVTRTPPTRGWTWADSERRLSMAQNPAYAGMDLYSSSDFIVNTSEPRLRGDGPME